MKRARTLLIVSHRWVGIALSLLFVVWFASGIAMLYARGMPRLTPELRLERLAAIDPAAVRLSPAEALGRAELAEAPDRAVLLTVMGRPAYRFGSSRPTTVFADDGTVLSRVGVHKAREVAAAFARQDEASVHHVATLTRPDQWTLTVREGPNHKFAVDDGQGTELYVSEQTAEVTVVTTQTTRLLAWVGAIPHWLYFAPLRLNQTVWRQVVLWTAGIGIGLALLGLVLGVVQLRVTRPVSLAHLGSYLPYSGWMRWHYITGLVFGLFTLTFVFSGWLSMEPFGWATSGGRFGAGLREAFTGGPGRLADFPSFTPASWPRLSEGRAVKEIGFVRIQDEPFLIVRREPDPAAGAEVRGHEPYFAARASDRGETVVAARTFTPRDRPFTDAEMLARVARAVPGTPIVEYETLSTYDSYYYSRDGLAPLPVLRVKLGDPERTWLYIDPRMSRLVGRVHRLDRVERWLYNGLHSLDFSFWYYRRPLWDVGMILLSLGGLLSSGIGLFLGFGRVARALGRLGARPRRSPAPFDISGTPTAG
jgi:hypothetical protein